MATLRKRNNGHWQARVRKANQNITKTFINKVDAERWAKQFVVIMVGTAQAQKAKKAKTAFEPLTSSMATRP